MAVTEYQVVGISPTARPDGVEKVTGASRFGADIQLPGLLHARLLRSPHVHARIKRLDLSRASTLPGVMAIMTAQDFPRVTGGDRAMGETSVDNIYLQDMILARETVKWQGHPIAAVAATTPHIAEEACALIEVEYEPLEPLTDLLTAMGPDAPVIHPDLRTRLAPGRGKGDRPTNVAMHILRERGDVNAAFAASAVVVEREFRTVMVHQGYIEPQSATAQVQPDGKVTLWTTTQSTFGIRDAVRDLLKLPEGDIKVIPMEVGGAFGGKFYPYLEPVVTVLSRKAGRPVRLTLNRAEVLQGTGPTPGSVVRLKMGAAADGTITAAQLWMAYEAGAYPGSPVGAAATTGLSPYRIQNLKIDGYDVVLNLPRVAAYRAPGATQAAFAVEQVVDMLAGKLGMDPLEFRLKNANREGDPRTDNNIFKRIGFIEVLEAARSHPHWQSPAPSGPNQGRGVACGFWMNWGGTAACQLTLNGDGTVNLATGTVDLTGSRTAMAQIAAEQLGLGAAQVNSAVTDTSAIGFNDGTGGSRTTYGTGKAVHNGAVALREELKRRAARMLEAAEEDLEWGQGRFQVKGAPARSITVAEVAAKQNQTGGPITVSGLATNEPGAPAFSLHMADVEVDPETGKVQILRYTAFQDAGKAINPMMVEGQMQGGAAQGIGWALNEEYAWDGGAMKNPTFLDYRMPVALDLPDIECVIVEVPSPDHPYGVRGVGEAPIIPPPAAIANALYQATGKRFKELPISPERVWRRLAE